MSKSIKKNALTCPKCGSKNVQSRAPKIYCNDCKQFTTTDGPPLAEKKEIEYGKDYIRVVTTSERIRSVEDAIREFKIDTNEWEVEPPIRIRTHEGYRKDRKSSWHVVNGKTISGDVEDTGNMLLVTLYGVDIRFRRKTEEIRATNVICDLIKDAEKNMPRVPKKVYPKGNRMLEIDMPDLHFGKLTWLEESGTDYDIKIAERMAKEAVDILLARAAHNKIERILFPLGNDWFNVDNKLDTTTGGTPQQEDTRWTKTFRKGWQLAASLINTMVSVAPVDVVIVVGNHDEQRTWYLGEVISAMYANNKNVTVENSARKRKYYYYGRNIIGFTHGYWEKIERLPDIMTQEVDRKKLAMALNREWHVADKHHAKDLILNRLEDTNGITIRWLRSLSGTDTWHFDKGFIGAPRAAEAILWHPIEGASDRYPAFPKTT